MKTFLDSFPVVVKMPVNWGDMDSFQHVNNVIYFRYFESARIKYFETLGWSGITGNMGIGPILGSISCRFMFPLTYPDNVYAGARITEIHTKRFTMEHQLISEKHQKPVAEGTSVVVCYNYQTGQSTEIPEIFRKSIEKLENRVF